MDGHIEADEGVEGRILVDEEGSQSRHSCSLSTSRNGRPSHGEEACDYSLIGLGSGQASHYRRGQKAERQNTSAYAHRANEGNAIW